MAFFNTNYPSAETGFATESGTVSIVGQDYSNTPQVQSGPRQFSGNVLAVKVDRKRVVLGAGGMFSARTTQPEGP